MTDDKNKNRQLDELHLEKIDKLMRIANMRDKMEALVTGRRQLHYPRDVLIAVALDDAIAKASGELATWNYLTMKKVVKMSTVSTVERDTGVAHQLDLLPEGQVLTDHLGSFWRHRHSGMWHNGSSIMSSVELAAWCPGIFDLPGNVDL